MSIKKTLAAAISRERKKRNLTQDQLASELRIKRSLLGAYEEARATPPLDSLLRIARFFDTTIEGLVEGDTLGKRLDAIEKRLCALEGGVR